MRLIPSLTLVVFALFQSGAVQAQDKDKEKDKKPDVGVKEITEVLGKSVEEWVKEMHSKDRSRAEIAIKMITAFSQAKALLALDDLLNELANAPLARPLDANSRLAVITALGAIVGQNPEKVPAKKLEATLKALKKSLSDQQVLVRIRAMAALVAIGPPAEPYLADLLNDLILQIDVEQRVAAINSIGMIISRTQKRDPALMKRAVTSLGIQTNHVQMIVRINALNALQVIGPDANETVPNIILQLHDLKGTWEARQMAALALGTVGFDALHETANFKKSQTALIGALEDPCSQVRLAAIRGLETHGSPYVVEKIKDPKDPKKTSALVPKPFSEFAPVIKELDKVAFKDPEPGIQITATLAVMKLTRSVPKKNLAHLKYLMVHDDAAIRGQATQAIGLIGPKAKEMVPELMERLHDKEPAVQMFAIWSLSRMGTNAVIAIPALQKLIEDKKVEDPIKKAAKEAIDIIEGKDKKDTKDPKTK